MKKSTSKRLVLTTEKVRDLRLEVAAGGGVLTWGDYDSIVTSNSIGDSNSASVRGYSK